MCVVVNVSTQGHKTKIGYERIERKMQGTRMCLNNTSSTAYTASLWDQHCPGDKGCSVRMQQEHFGKYSMLESGKSRADRQALTTLTAQSLSRLLIPPDTNGRLFYIHLHLQREARERGRQQKLSAISDFSLFLSAFLQTFSLIAPPLCLPLPFALFLTFSATFSLSFLPYLLWSVILFWGSAETSSPLQPYSLLTLDLKFICKHSLV